MNELRLLFRTTAASSDYTVRIVPSWGNASDAIPFEPFLKDDDYEDLRWYLEDFMDLPDGGSLTRAQRIEARLRDWGRGLHDAIFSAETEKALLSRLLAAPEPRVLTIGTREPGVLQLPWELLADGAGILAPRVSIRRQLEEPINLVPRNVVVPLRILYILSRPGDTGFIDPRLTTRSLFEAIEPLGANVWMDFCRPPTLGRMDEMLREAVEAGDPYDLVHFDGHGTLGALYFERPDDGSGEPKMDPVSADGLGNLLAQHQIPLVILESCRSAALGEAAIFGSIAPRLIEAGVGSVLSMGHAVHVEAARRLLDRFYRELARGTTIGQAAAQARAALLASPDRWIEYGPQGRTVTLQDWFLPHLYQRGLDEPLLPPAATGIAGIRPRQFDVFLSHNHADSSRVERLARTLSDKHGLRVWLDKWEGKPGPLKPQCEVGIVNSRYTVVVGSDAALKSKWVDWEIETALAHNPDRNRLMPVKFEAIALGHELDENLWVDFTDSGSDDAGALQLARLIRSTDAWDARQRRGFRAPLTSKDQVGAFPPAPVYGFQGRARELHQIERQFRAHRAVLLHAMGGMGKTALATEGAHWWTRTGLFPDGACFVSFEQCASAERVVQVLGTYLEGPNFESLPASEQRRRALESFGQKEVLLVWDNFESVLPAFQSGQGAELYSAEERDRLYDLFRELTEGAGRGRLLITCRPGDEATVALPTAHKMELQGLGRPDSLWLLSRVIAKIGLTLDDPRLSKGTLDPLLQLLADHPLSIELIGPHLRRFTPEEISADFSRLLAEFKVGAGQERNESLLASLAFSVRRLSHAAQLALPWLGLFSTGVFEQLLLDVSEIPPAEWQPVRAELEATALIRVERDIDINGRPYLRFHPTLASAVSRAALPDDARERFVAEYLALMDALNKALSGSLSRWGLEVLAREEANYRTAVRWAAADQSYAIAAALGDTFRDYLGRAGRLSERDRWVAWLAGEIGKGGFSEEAATYEREQAWSLFTQGKSGVALQMLRALVERLRHTAEFDPRPQLALASTILGRVLQQCGLDRQAIPILEDVVEQLERSIERAAGSDVLSALLHSVTPELLQHDLKEATQRVEGALASLSMALLEMSNALHGVGRLDDALEAASKGLRIDQALGRNSELAAAHGHCATILAAQGRFAQADAHYVAAFTAASRAGNRELEATSLQHQGILASSQGQLDRATSLYQRALKLFQDMDDSGSIMRTYNLLGSVERKSARLAEARTWYERSREIARRLGDTTSVSVATQNLGIVFQLEGEAARRDGDEQAARQRFEEAKRSVQESLEAWQTADNEPYAAASLFQLGKICFLLQELPNAERYLQQSRTIHERLGLKEVEADYIILAEIARARGDTAQAAEWERRSDTLQAELARRARGESGFSPQFAQAVQQISRICAQAGFGQEEPIGLDPDVESALAAFEKLPAPFPDLGAFLRRIAAGELIPPPSTLPAELQHSLQQLLEDVREARA